MTRKRNKKTVSISGSMTTTRINKKEMNQRKKKKNLITTMKNTK